MGLLEKAGNISSEDEKPETKIPKKAVPVAAPAPVKAAKPVKTAKKAKRAEKKKKPEKKVREKKPRAPRVKKELPPDFEVATRGQRLTRRIVDFLVSYGWSLPILVVTAWGSYFNPTPFIILGLGLIVFNLWFMPSYAGGRSVGNWISRTRYVNTRGESPIWIYFTLKGMTTLFILIGLWAVSVVMSNKGFGDTTGSQIFSAIGILMVIPPILDYIMYKLRGDLGLWDTAFGGVWLVRTTKSTEAKGWLKRLESISDFTESKGWLSDEEKSS
jgi:hypothetical protein